MLEGLKELGEELSVISGCQELGVIIVPSPPNGEPFIPPPSPPPPPIHGITEWLKKYGALLFATSLVSMVIIGVIGSTGWGKKK